METLNTYFEKVCELDIINNIEKAQYILDEIVQNGQIQEMSKSNILEPLKLYDKSI